MAQKHTRFRLLMNSSVIFSITMFVFAFAVGGALFMFSTRHAVRAHKNDELAGFLRGERTKLEKYVSGKADTVTKLAASLFIRRYFDFPDNDVLEKMALEDIARYRSRDKKGSAVFWVNNMDKKLYYNGKHTATINPSDPNSYWYNMTLYETVAFNLSINYSHDLKKARLWVNAPVFSNNLPTGLVGMEADLPAFMEAIYGEHTGVTELYFFSASGKITCAKDLGLVTSRKGIDDKFGYLSGELMAAAKRLGVDEVRTFSTPVGEIGMTRLSSLDWYALALSPNAASNHKTAMVWLFISMVVTMGVIMVVFNLFIAKLFKPLGGTMRALEAALKVKDDFLAKMSHEIRTPMNAITGMAELALREEMSTNAQEHVYTIKQAGSNLLSIINDILDLSKIESGKLEIIPAEYHFGSLVNDVVSIIRMRVVGSEVRFVVNVDSNIPGVLIGDEVRVRQILLNILSNAVKYTKEGFISLVIYGRPVDDDTVILTIDVADTGRGIKHEDIGKLFGTFVQVDVGSNRGIEGTGLGLVITKNLTAAMGGNISVASEYGKGSTFTVSLPQKIHYTRPMAAVDSPKDKSVIVCERRDIYANSMACTIDNLGVSCTSVRSLEELRGRLAGRDYSFVFVESSLHEDVRGILAKFGSRAQIVLLTSFGNVVADKNLSVIAMPAHSISVANILNGVSDGFSYHTEENTVVTFNAPDARVLVVDDIKTNLEVTSGLLSPYRMRVDLCLSGAEAIRMVKDADYDLIFMDHMMPEMDGIETAKRIRKTGGICSKVPIVALTANAVSGAKEMFLENDFNGFLSKPVDIPKLNAILEKWIPAKKQRPPAKKTERAAAVPEIAIEGVDTKTGISRMGGAVETYLRTLSVFVSDGRVKAGELRRSLATGDLPRFTMNAHALKGASANVGAAAFSEAAKALELAGKREDWAFINLNIERLLADLEALLNSIDAALSTAGGARTQQPIDRGTVEAALRSLRAAVGNLDPDAINAAAGELRRIMGSAGGGGKIGQILQNTLIGEYDTVVSLIDSLIGRAQS